jgi:hypothetical protein
VITCYVSALNNGRFRADAPGWSRVFSDEWTATNEAVHYVEAGGGGFVIVKDRAGATKDRIGVSASTPAASPQLPLRQPPPVTPQPPSRAVQPTPDRPAADRKDPMDDVRDVVKDAKTPAELLDNAKDKVAEKVLGGWWSKRSDTEKVATALLITGAALGPLGQGLLAVVHQLYVDAIPTTKQIEATALLLWLTLPVAAFLIVIVAVPGKHGSFPVALILAGIASVASASLTYVSHAPTKLADFYCYADASNGVIVYEHQCREFNTAGFVAENVSRLGSPSRSANIFSSAVAYTSDARGSLMVFAGVLAAVGIGLLFREHA